MYPWFHTQEQFARPLELSSLHVIGEQDPLRPAGESLASLFDQYSRQIIWHPGARLHWADPWMDGPDERHVISNVLWPAFWHTFVFRSAFTVGQHAQAIHQADVLRKLSTFVNRWSQTLAKGAARQETRG